MKNINGIVDSLIDLIKDNKSLLKRLYSEDEEVCSFGFEIDKLICLLQASRKKQMSSNNTKPRLVYHYGNPYITLLLCLEAIQHNCQIMIGIEQICYGINKAIVKMVNDVLKEYRKDMQISLKMNVSKSSIEAIDVDEIICLGNSNAYTNFRKIENKDVRYIPLFDIVLYYDSEEYEELVESIRCFAIESLYEIEIFDETENFEDVIYMINGSLPKHCAVILSKDKNKQEEFRQEIKAQSICVNENPFKQFEMKIPKGIWDGD